MLKIIAISDQHGHLPEIPPCDLLLIGGDICPGGGLEKQSFWLDTHFRHWLDRIPAKEAVAIAGNHDKIFANAPEMIPSGLRFHYLKDSSIEIFKLKIYGTPWQLPFWGVFNKKEEELDSLYQAIPYDLDILLTHGPPYGIRDGVPVQERLNEDLGTLLHVGSHALKKRILEIQPKLVVFGHIHSAYGVTKQEGITYVNASLLNDEMHMVYQPIVINASIIGENYAFTCDYC